MASTFDVYAQNYVPLWLRAVNESPVYYYYSELLRGIDFQEYIAGFAGSSFLSVVQPEDLTTPGQSNLRDHTLKVDNYESYWAERIRYELSEQFAQVNLHSLYSVNLSPSNTGPYIFSLHVPGLREHAPRVDLGDLVHVRPLSVPYARIGQDTVTWYDKGKARNERAPGSTGTAFAAVVWGLDRKKESVLLRIDGYPADLKCNACFTVQPRYHESILRATAAVANNLTRNKWLRSMLMPTSEDGLVQSNLNQAYFGLDWFDNALNWEQKKAVHTVVKAEYGAVPFLVFGPPGTGKTKTIVEMVLQLLFHTETSTNGDFSNSSSISGTAHPIPSSCDTSGPNHHLLVCAPSDAAADTLATRLATHLQPSQMLRLNHWTRTFAEVPGNLLPYTYSSNDLFGLPPFEMMMSYRVVVTTCRDADILVQARLTNNALFQVVSTLTRLVTSRELPHAQLHWTALLLDEAGQATEPEALIPLQVVMPPTHLQQPHLPQFIAAGDEFQLGPKLASRQSTGLHISLFQRLSERTAYLHHPLSRMHGAPHLSKAMLPMIRPAFTNLKRNYRSHPSILAIPSALFYNDTLIPESVTSEIVSNWSGWPSVYGMNVSFVNTTARDDVEQLLSGSGTGSGALTNDGEIQIALSKVQSLLQHGSTTITEQQIAVISPFRAQVYRLRQVFRQHKLYSVNIGPLEAFQGLESRIVILCTTRTRLGDATNPAKYVKTDQELDLGIIDQPKRFNVAITRAKEGLIVIGNSECLTCTGDKHWSAFLNFCKRNGCHEGERLQWKVQAQEYEMGRLEKALRYKEFQDLNHNALSSVQKQTGLAKRLLLKGSQPDVGDMSAMRDVALSAISEFVWDVEDEEDTMDDVLTVEGDHQDHAE